MAGTGIWLVVPQKGSTVAQKYMSALVTAMRIKDLALVARYTYHKTASPKIMILFPNTVNSNHNSFLMYELFYKDNFVKVNFPTLRSKKNETITNEQYDAVEKFIDSMDLMSGASEAMDVEDNIEKPSNEYFKRLLDPSLQHMYRAIANRVINPKDPVLKLDNDLMEMLQPPKKSEAKPYVDKIKTLFPLEEAKVTGKEAFLEKMRKVDDSGYASSMSEKTSSDINSPVSDIIEIGTVEPAKDFVELYRRGERFHVLAKQMQNIINELTFKTVTMANQKISEAMFSLRETAKEKAPYIFNEWVVEFKEKLIQRGKLTFWNDYIVKNHLGLITAEESEMSTVSEEDANNFYQNKKHTAAPDSGIDQEMAENLDDMFNEM